MSLSLASASSQYLRNNSVSAMPLPSWRSAICFFRTTTSAEQTLMYCEQRPVSTLQYYRKMKLTVSGSTVEVSVEILDNVGAPITSGAITSGGIFSISANTWACAGCSISSSQLYCWLVDAAGNEATPGSNSHSVTEGSTYRKQSIGATHPGGEYMNGQIAHAIAYQGAISVEDFRAVALGRTDPRTIGDGGSQLLYWVPLITAEYSAKFGAILSGASTGKTIAFNAQNSPTLSPENPNVFSAAGMLM